VVVVFHC